MAFDHSFQLGTSSTELADIENCRNEKRKASLKGKVESVQGSVRAAKLMAGNSQSVTTADYGITNPELS